MTFVLDFTTLYCSHCKSQGDMSETTGQVLKYGFGFNQIALHYRLSESEERFVDHHIQRGNSSLRGYNKGRVDLVSIRLHYITD